MCRWWSYALWCIFSRIFCSSSQVFQTKRISSKVPLVRQDEPGDFSAGHEHKRSEWYTSEGATPFQRWDLSWFRLLRRFSSAKWDLLTNDNSQTDRKIDCPERAMVVEVAVQASSKEEGEDLLEQYEDGRKGAMLAFWFNFMSCLVRRSEPAVTATSTRSDPDSLSDEASLPFASYESTIRLQSCNRRRGRWKLPGWAGGLFYWHFAHVRIQERIVPSDIPWYLTLRLGGTRYTFPERFGGGMNGRDDKKWVLCFGFYGILVKMVLVTDNV